MTHGYLRQILETMGHQVTPWIPQRRWLSHLRLGDDGERVAANYLKRKGYRIITQGYRTRYGEIDIVGLKKNTVVFVEVKTRRSHVTGHPSQAVDRQKQERISRLATAFCKRHRLAHCPIQFDVVAISWMDRSEPPTIEHFPSAFRLPSIGTTE